MNERDSTNSIFAQSLNGWASAVVGVLLFYVLSSGPLMGAAFWLRQATHIDAFYLVMWIYAPLLMLGHNTPFMWYIDWWVVDVFHTVGPG